MKRKKKKAYVWANDLQAYDKIILLVLNLQQSS
jgi:hypothetical protein